MMTFTANGGDLGDTSRQAIRVANRFLKKCEQHMLSSDVITLQQQVNTVAVNGEAWHYVIRYPALRGKIMNKYVAQKGDICRWSDRKANYAKEYNGQQWSNPIALSDLAIANATMYVRVFRPNYEL